MLMDLSYGRNIDLLGLATWMRSSWEQSLKPVLRSRNEVGVPRHSERSHEVNKMIRPSSRAAGDANVPGRAERVLQDASETGLMEFSKDKWPDPRTQHRCVYQNGLRTDGGRPGTARRYRKNEIIAMKGDMVAALHTCIL